MAIEEAVGLAPRTLVMERECGTDASGAKLAKTFDGNDGAERLTQ
jgi:hypothetical protein